MLDSGRDPNILLRCVQYLENTHATAAMSDDTTWFRNMLEVLLQLTIPDSFADAQNDEFFRDIEKAIEDLRSHLRKMEDSK